MAYHPDIHHRRSIRLKGYDYSKDGAYFVTICTHERACLFGDIVDGVMRLNEAGEVARKCWNEIPGHFPHVELDAFVVMPNHVHGVVIVSFNAVTGDAVGAKNFSPLPPTQTSAPGRPCGTSKTVGSVVRGFKIGVTKWVRRNTAIHDVWQRNYFERVIRDDREWSAIREYITNNPAHWALDTDNPYNTP